MNKARLITGSLLLLLSAVSLANAQEWTQWRGPARDHNHVRVRDSAVNHAALDHHDRDRIANVVIVRRDVIGIAREHHKRGRRSRDGAGFRAHHSSARTFHFAGRGTLALMYADQSAPFRRHAR